MNRLEVAIAWRYLRSRGTSRLFSFISVIAMGGVVVGVSALIVINGVMTGMQGELREKILVGSPDIRVLSFGDNLRIEHWEGALDTVRHQPGVVAAAPFVLTQGLATSGHDYAEGVFVAGIEAPGAAAPDRHGHPALRGAGGLPLREFRRVGAGRGDRAAARGAAQRVPRGHDHARLAGGREVQRRDRRGRSAPVPLRGDGRLQDGDVRVRQLVRVRPVGGRAGVRGTRTAR